MASLPLTMKRIMVHTPGADFRKVTNIVEMDMPKPGPAEVLIKNRYVGINATDINITSGRYKAMASETPFVCGVEGMGEVVKAGADSKVKEGQIVVYLKAGAFSEYTVVPAAEVIPVPSADPALMSIVLSGLTASISLEKEADLKPGKTVLVTAAAGGTGQFAVQLAKAAGCHVIGTCSTDAKVEFLKSIGCDRPINYKKEKLEEIFPKEYPKGLDVIYECIGGEVFDTALKNLAVQGRLIVIGMISSYQSGEMKSQTFIPREIITKSASVRGFFLMTYLADFPQHIGTLTKMYAEGKLKIVIDQGSGKPFKGLEGIADGIDYMFESKNTGKVVVTLAEK